MMRLHVKAALAGTAPLLLLAACSNEQPPPAAPGPVAEPPIVPAPAPTNLARDFTAAWTASSDARSVTLALSEADTIPPSPVLTMTCSRGAVLTVESPSLDHLGSEERLSVGVGDTVVALPATKSPQGSGVRSSGPVMRELLEDMAVGRRISVSYGPQALGPFPPAPDPLTSRFVQRCRDYLESGAR